MFLGKKFRDYLGLAMALFFGFSTVISLMFNKDYLYKIGSRKITQKDLFNFGGGRDESAFRRVLSKLYQDALIGSECDKLGIIATEKDIRRLLKDFMTFNQVTDDESFNKVSQGYTKEGLVCLFRNNIESSQLFYIPNRFATVKKSFVKEFINRKLKSVSGYYKVLRFGDSSEKEVKSTVENLKKKFFSSKKFFSANGFKEFSKLSINSCFKDLSNGCLCPKCFDRDNKFNIDRKLALILLYSEGQKFLSFEDEEKVIVFFIEKVEEETLSDEDVNILSSTYNNLIKSMIQIAYIGDLYVQNKFS